MKKTPVEILRSIDILSGLSEVELEGLFQSMKKESYSAGQTLFKEGDPGDSMYIILSGSMAITVETQDGITLELAVIPEGNFFGEMSIFDNSPRSATCVPKTDTELLSLKGADFYSYIQVHPQAGIGIMHRMLNTTTGRLQATGAFLSDMVTWGEQARKRAITDDFTGLYNRRFLDQSIEGRFREAQEKNQPLSLVMIDLDHFGTLNNLYGQDKGDEVLLEVVKIYQKVFRKRDILARYGGDEFTFLLPDTRAERAQKLCERMIREMAKIDLLKNLQGDLKLVSASVGIASYPAQAETLNELKERSDQGVYQAKEAGRARAVIWEDPKKGETKHALKSIAQRRKVIHRILDLIDEKDNFLIVGHHQPDEDCVSSIIAMSLLIRDMNKKVYLMIPRNLNRKYEYMINISRYNSIEILYNDEKPPEGISALFVLDTPKPEMRQEFPGGTELIEDPDIPVVEVDHHLEADSGYIGDPDYRLVDEAASASELVGMIAFKLKNRKDLIERYNMEDIFSRNFVLAVLTGIVGDTKMGKFLKTRKERWFYNLFSNMFNRMLEEKTHHDSKNFSSMKEVFKELQLLSDEEDQCFKMMHSHKIKEEPRIGALLVPSDVMDEIGKNYEHDTIVTVARFLTDHMAESSGYLGLVIYPDDVKDSGLIQFRLRRSQNYQTLDLRKVLEVFEIENGGGHPGAIGFRIPADEIKDLKEYSHNLIHTLEEMLKEAEK